MREFLASKLGKRIILFIAFLCVLSTYTSAAPKEGSELLGQYPSPNGKFIVDAYVHHGGWTLDDTSFAIVRSEGFPFMSRMIYWRYHCNGCFVEWKDNYTVTINGETLNIFLDKYKEKNYIY